MELRPGYSRSEVGLIPASWNVKSLAAVADRIMVGIASAATHAYRSRGIPLLRNQNIKAGFLDDGDLLHVDSGYEETFRNKRLKAGDLLTARTGYPGVTCVVPAEYEAAQSFTTLITRPKRDVIDSHFLCQFVNSDIGQAFFTRSQIGGAQKNVNAGTLRGMPVPVPPLSEQKAIAAALSDVDALLGALDRIIAKKRDLKQAAMQQLLTGQTRLPGFGGKWETKRLGDHVVFLRNGTQSRAELDETDETGPLRYMHYGDIHTASSCLLDSGRTAMPRLPEVKARTLDRLANGDVVFVDASEDLAGVGKAVELRVPEGMQVVAGLHTIAARFDKRVLADGFKAYLQFVPAFRKHLVRLAAGTKVYATSHRHIADVTMPMPSAPEQVGIAGVLADMDAELTALEQRRDKTRLLKQGMMQELLTGRTRLV